MRNTKTGPLTARERQVRDRALRAIEGAAEVLTKLGIWTISMEHARAVDGIKDGAKRLTEEAAVDDRDSRPLRRVG